VVSSGAVSRTLRPELEPRELVRVGELVPGTDGRARARRIDLRDGRTAADSIAREIRTIWAVADGPPQLRLAIVDGSRSRTEKISAPRGARLEVGQTLSAPGGPVWIVALRARGRTWRRPGDAFLAEEIGVVYGRRTETPPAGRRAWSSDRPTPSSRASSTSRVGRSRSSPGVSRNRSVPRARTAGAGATQRYSSSS
jgi:uncharacterized Zn finger protein